MNKPDEATKGEIAEDGQEEVTSPTAIENGLLQDPTALDPAEAARARPLANLPQ